MCELREISPTLCLSVLTYAAANHQIVIGVCIMHT